MRFPLCPQPLLVAILGVMVLGGILVGAERLSAQQPLPLLDMPDYVASTLNQPVSYPIELVTEGNGVYGIAFSLDYDPVCLQLNAPNPSTNPLAAVSENLPAGYSLSVSHDIFDFDGELDIAIFGNSASPSLPDSRLMEISFIPWCNRPSSASWVTNLAFGIEPSPSFAGAGGFSLTGITSDGSIRIAPAKPTSTATATTTPSVSETPVPTQTVIVPMTVTVTVPVTVTVQVTVTVPVTVPVTVTVTVPVTVTMTPSATVSPTASKTPTPTETEDVGGFSGRPYFLPLINRAKTE